jgi:hypothetical protein
MGARLDVVVTPAQSSSEGMRGVSVVVEDEVRMSIAIEPAGNSVALLFECGADNCFGAFAVIPGRGGGDVALVCEAFAEFGVGASYVFAQSVAAGGLILLQGVVWLGGLNGCLAFIGRRSGARCQNGEEHECE